MEDDKRPKTANWAPGTLEQTRKAIGAIDPEEAKLMTKVLGGEIMYERTNTQAPSSKPVSKNTGRIVRTTSSSTTEKSETPQNTTPKGRKNREELPVVTTRVSGMIDKLMMSDEYKIKPNYGLFNFIKLFQKNGTEQILSDFCSITLKLHIENIEGFITVIKTLIQMAPASYKAKIANGTEAKFKFLRTVAGWTMQGIKLAHLELLDLPKPYLTVDMINYVRQVYRPLVQVYYYGETKIPKLIKEIYTDEASYPDAPQDKLSSLAKEAITQWLYIQNEVIKKLYPLLMRMCCDSYEEYPAFFKAKIPEILKFLGLHKFDLLLPDKPKEEKPAEQKTKAPAERQRGVKDGIVTTGLSLLNKLFPDAGFDKLDSHPDLYPYFQPLYKFSDGFNVLSPENPLQVTVVLLRIIEDFLQGCRDIQFVEGEEDIGTLEKDSIFQVLEEWTNYRETVFERLYCTPLNDFVNQLYTQNDFDTTQFGKKLLTSLLWQTKYHFLPTFKFDQLILEHPADESKIKPLFIRTDFTRRYLTEAVNQCDAQVANKGSVAYVKNPWEHYNFDISNEVSKRLDVLLGAHNTGPNTNATNANLLKYTLCVLAVLDWWINNQESPAYLTSPMHIYRISEEDGKPIFSVPERSDQNKVFAEAIKAAYNKKK